MDIAVPNHREVAGLIAPIFSAHGVEVHVANSPEAGSREPATAAARADIENRNEQV